MNDLNYRLEEVQKKKNIIYFLEFFLFIKGFLTAFGYEFKITPQRGTFDECRQQCHDMGGDLIQINFGENGTKYHSLVLLSKKKSFIFMI